VTFVGVKPGDPAYSTTPDNVDNLVVPDVHTSPVSAINFGYTGTLTVNLSNWDTTSGTVLPGCPMAYDLEVTSKTRGTNDQIRIPMGSSLSMQLVQGLYTLRLAANSNTNQAYYTESVSVDAGVTTTRNIRTSTVATGSTPAFPLRVFNRTGGNVWVRRTIPGPAADVIASLAANAIGAASVNACSIIQVRDAAGGGGALLDTFAMTNSSYNRNVNDDATHTVSITTDGAPAARRQVYITVGTVGITGIPIGTVYKNRRVIFTIPRNSRVRTFDSTGNQLTNIGNLTSDQTLNY
jgi:hypothetical protein